MLPLESPRLVLRRFCADDIPAFVAYRNDPEVARYQSWEAFSLKEAAAMVVNEHEPLAPGEWFQIALALRDSDALVGDCGLRVHESEPRDATIGITVARSHQGRGFALEALTCLFEHLFTRAGVERVVADTDPGERGRVVPPRTPRHAPRRPTPGEHLVQGPVGGRVPLRHPAGRVVRQPCARAGERTCGSGQVMLRSSDDDLTTSGYNLVMDGVRIAELKARLSEYLRQVRRGESIVVLDRDRPVARLVPYEEPGLRVRRAPPGARLGDVAVPPPLDLGFDIVDLLLEERQSHR